MKDGFFKRLKKQFDLGYLLALVISIAVALLIGAAIIAVTAFVTGVINCIFFPNVALCGASGICFAFILLTSFTSFKEGEIPLTFILVAVVFIGNQIFEGLFMDDNISNLSQILGGVVGGIAGYSLKKKQL